MIGAWFAPHLKPTRRGLYPVRLPKHPRVWKCYWNGSQWGAVSDNAKQAQSAFANLRSPVQNKAWFGFARSA